MSTIHIARNDTNLGVFSEEDIRKGLQEARFYRSDLGWKKGMSDWQPLSEWPEFSNDVHTPESLIQATRSAHDTTVHDDQDDTTHDLERQALLPAWETRKLTGQSTLSAIKQTIGQCIQATERTFRARPFVTSSKDAYLFAIIPSIVSGLTLGFLLLLIYSITGPDSFQEIFQNILRSQQDLADAIGIPAYKVYIGMQFISIPIGVIMLLIATHALAFFFNLAAKLFGHTRPLAQFQSARVLFYIAGAFAWLMLPVAIMQVLIPQLLMLGTVATAAINFASLIFQFKALGNRHRISGGITFASAIAAIVCLCLAIIPIVMAFVIAAVILRP